MSLLETLRSEQQSNVSPRACGRCGTRTAEKAQVQVAVRELGPHGQAKGGKAVSSRSRTFCGNCAAEVFVAMRGTLDAEAGK